MGGRGDGWEGEMGRGRDGLRVRDGWEGRHGFEGERWV